MIVTKELLQEKIDQLRQQLTALQAECDEQARLNGMGAERELALRAQLAEAEAKAETLERAAEILADGRRTAIAERDRASGLLKRCGVALRIGECDMHYHLPSGHRVSLLGQIDEATKELAK